MFHKSGGQLGEADACNYCGAEFPRSGVADLSQASQAGIVEKRVTDQDWNEQIRHLVEIHKFGMCDAGKMYYRADHFCQHLRRFHNLTNGSWRRLYRCGHHDSTAS